MDWADSRIAYHDVAHQNDHAFVVELQLVEHVVRVRFRVCHVDQICTLNYDECKLLEQILVLVESREWESWREYHVDKHYLESSQAENSIVKESCLVVQVDSLVQCVPALGEFGVCKFVLVP